MEQDRSLTDRAAEKTYCGDMEQELHALRKELETLRVENRRQRRLIRQNARLLRSLQEAASEAEKGMEWVQNSKFYRMALEIRRFLAQFLRGESGGPKAYLRWAFSRRRKAPAGLPMREFDMLFPLRKNLSEQILLTEQKLAYLAGTETEFVLIKRSRKIFIFAGVPYYDIGGGQRFAQIAKTFNAMGFQVYYFYSAQEEKRNQQNIRIPAVLHIHLDQYSLDEFAEELEQDSVLIFEFPHEKCKPYMDYANAHGVATVYEHVDNWDSDLGKGFYDRELFARWIRDVQHVTVTARMLGEKIAEMGRRDYIYCPNAADTAIFEPLKNRKKPADLVVGKRTLLYFGSLWGDWFDWELIAYVAEHCDCAVNLIGDCTGLTDKLSNLPANIHFLGLKKQTELPAYLQHSDIALLPFKNDNIGKYVSPLKVFEYIAMNKPVLSTPLDELTGYPNVVASDDRDVWVRTVNEGIHTVDASVFTAANNWYARCNQILDLAGRPQIKQPSISVIVLNRNNKNVIFRCVDSLLAFSDDYRPEIIVVDNDSTDGSRERLLAEYSGRITVVCNDKNGCACGRNLGVRHASGDLLWFLDSDQWVVGAHYLDTALQLLEQNPGIGAVGWAAGWLDRETIAGAFTDELPDRGICVPWILCRTDIAYLGSGGLLMRKRLFEQIGGFDEAYDPTCFEDTDLSMKIRNAGWELAYCPYMALMHLPHQTTGAGSKRHAELMQRNGSYFRRKWEKENPELLSRCMDG